MTQDIDTVSSTISSKLIQLQDAYAQFGLKQKVNLGFQAGQFISLIGLNGSGKSSLLKLICGLNYRSGVLNIKGQALRSLPAHKRARVLSYLPQNPPVSTHWTVLELIKQGLYPHQAFYAQDINLHQEEQKRIESTCKELSLEPLLNRTLAHLSGGELQKALIARLLIQDCQIILLDEPLSALDWPKQESILRILKKQCIEHNALVIIAIHDLNLAALYSDHLVLLKDGLILAQDHPQAMFNSNLIKTCFEAEALQVSHPQHDLKQVLPWGLNS